MEGAPDDLAIKFTYPWYLRLLFGAGSLFFIFLAILSAMDIGEGTVIWVPLLFLIMGLANLLLLIRLSGQVVIYKKEITFTRFGLSTVIAFSELTQVKHRVISNSLTLSTLRKNITIHKQLNYYYHFYAIVSRHFPPKASQYSFDIPLEVQAPLLIQIVFWVYLAINFALITMSIVNKLHVAYTAFFVAIFLIFLFAVLKRPWKIRFDTSEIVIYYPISRVVYSFDDLFALSVKGTKGAMGGGKLQVAFLSRRAKRTVVDFEITYPIELLMEFFSDQYGKILPESLLHPFKQYDFNLYRVILLLREMFTVEGLIEYIKGDRQLRNLAWSLPTNPNHLVVLFELTIYAEKQSLIPYLLESMEKRNPALFAQYSPYKIEDREDAEVSVV